MTAEKIRTIRFHEYGEPAAVLRLEEASIPAPNAGHVAVRVHAGGLNPADWRSAEGCLLENCHVASGWMW
jgi:NADPH:quinone reductase-like Zn-dependent oxidoreductase